MTGFRFQDPLWFVLWIPLLVCAFVVIRSGRRTALLYSSARLLKGLPDTWSLRIKRLLPWVRTVGLALIVVALARPQRGRSEFRVQSEGIAIQMCLDQSGSMDAMDFFLEDEQVDRLTAVKSVLRDFVSGGSGLDGRPNDLIGLVTFGGFADSKCPLTLDHGALLQIADTIETAKPIHNSAGQIVNRRLLEEERATAIGDAVALAVDRLTDVEAKSKVIILLSDGENNAGVASPEEAAKAAAQSGIKIYTIGVGSTGVAPFVSVDVFGRKVLARQPVSLDETALKMLADQTGGRYFNARDTETLEAVYEQIDALEKTLSEGRLYTEYRELYQYAMFPGIGLVLFQTVLACTRFRSLP